MFAFSDPNSRQYARTTGLLYLVIAIAGGFSIAFVPSVLYVAGDPAATFANIQNNRSLFNLGILGDVVMMMAELLATTMLYFMFRQVNPTLSLAAALARFAMAIVMAAMLFFHAAALALVDPDFAMQGFSMAQRTDLGGLFLYVHNSGVWIWQIFFAFHLAVLGWLVVHSGKYPAVLGGAMSLGAMGYLLDSTYAFFFPEMALLGHARVGLLAIVTLAEIGFALWLLIVGPKEKTPKTADAVPA